MPKGVYKRKAKRRGRPKGSRNKKFSMAGLTNYEPSDEVSMGELKTNQAWINANHIATEPASFISRLEAATVKYEQAIKEAIEALKGQ